MTTLPVETPIELFDIALEELLDDLAMCRIHTDQPAVALAHHVDCTAPARFVCDSCVERIRLNVALAIAGRCALHCNLCGAKNIPPADIIIRPI